MKALTHVIIHFFKKLMVFLTSISQNEKKGSKIRTNAMDYTRDLSVNGGAG